MKLILSALLALSMITLTSLSQAAVSVDLKALEASIEKDVAGPAFTKVILPLEGFLVQNTFKELADSFNRKDLITILSVKKEVRYYVIAPKTVELLTYLANKKISIVIVTSLEVQEAKAILQEIKLPTLNKTVDVVAALGAMDWTEEVNAKDFGAADKTLTIAYQSMKVTPADQVINVGPYFRPFNDYATAIDYRERASEDYKYLYPTDEDSWKAERFKVARALYLLRAANLTDKDTFKKKIAELKKVSALELGQLGTAIANDQQRLAFQWSGAAGAMTCKVYDRIQRKSIQDAGFDDCLQVVGADRKFEIDQKTRRAKSCILSYEGKIIGKLDNSALCLETEKKTKVAFDFSTKKCSVFSSDENLIAVLDSDKSCDKESYRIFDPSQKEWQVFKAFKGMDSLTAAQILKKYFSWTARSPLKYSASLHSMIASDEPNKVKESYHEDCMGAIKNYIKSGKNFYSKEILSRTVLAREFPRADVKDLTFHHNTDTTALTEIGEKKKFNDIYAFLHSKCNPRFPKCIAGWFFYVASENESNKRYGEISYEVKIRQNAKIFMLMDTRENGHQYFWDTINAIEGEFFQQDENLKICKNRGANVAIPNTPSILVALAAEASHVDAYAYFGYDNWDAAQADRGPQWMTLVGPWSIESLKRVK